MRRYLLLQLSAIYLYGAGFIRGFFHAFFVKLISGITIPMYIVFVHVIISVAVSSIMKSIVYINRNDIFDDKELANQGVKLFFCSVPLEIIAVMLALWMLFSSI